MHANKDNYKDDKLICTLEIIPPVWQKGEAVDVIYSVENISPLPVKLASDFFWFRLRITDSEDNVILSGMENCFLLACDDLPMAIIKTLKPGESIKLKSKTVFDKVMSSTFEIYDLKPGNYKYSVVYRVEPGKEPDGADILLFEEDKITIWTGILQSNTVNVTIKNNAL